MENKLAAASQRLEEITQRIVGLTPHGVNISLTKEEQHLAVRLERLCDILSDVCERMDH